MDEYAAVRRLRLCVRVGMGRLNNITNFVTNVIERVRQAVFFLMCRLSHEVLEARGGGGRDGFMGIINYIF